MEEKEKAFNLIYELKALIDVWFDPRKMFQKVLSHKKFWIPIVVIITFSIPQIIVTAKIVHQDRIKYIQMNPKLNDNLKMNALERMKEFNAKKIIIRQSISMIIVMFIALFVVSGLLLFIATLFGGDIRYAETLTIVSYSNYIDWLWGGILKTILTVIKGTGIGVSTGLSMFVSSEPFSPTYRILSNIDFFNIWSYIVIAIGLSYLMKIDLKKGIMISFIVYFIKLGILIIPVFLF